MKRLNCAIYTRKSSDEGLEKEFNSLDAQREACEAFIASQKHAGWVAVRDLYDDGGLSGGHWNDRIAAAALRYQGRQSSLPDAPECTAISGRLKGVITGAIRGSRVAVKLKIKSINQLLRGSCLALVAVVST